MLRPNPKILRCLISTTASIVGEFETDDFLIAIAWPNLHGGRAEQYKMAEGPTHRRYFIASIEVEEPDRGKVLIPSYNWVGDIYAALLAVYYGKRFDYHGVLQVHGRFSLPTVGGPEIEPLYRLAAYRSSPRSDGVVALNLDALTPLRRILTFDDTLPPDVWNTFRITSGFYASALRSFADRPEAAYLDLITAGEVLSQFYTFEDSELFQDDMLSLLQEIRTTLPKGDKKERNLRKQLFQVRRAFWLTIERLIKPEFFGQSEASNEWEALREDTFKSTVLAAYDLRSRYVHTGELFGGWLRDDRSNAERHHGKPVVDDESLEKILYNSPTFCGLERIIRMCLLRFLHLKLCPIDSRLD